MSSQISFKASKQSTFTLLDQSETIDSTQDQSRVVDVFVKTELLNPTYSIHDALLSGSKRDCRRFLALGQQDLLDAAGDTPLHIAIQLDSLYACTLILKKNPNLLLENSSQHMPMTPLEFAQELDRQDLLIKILRQATTLDEVVPRQRQVRFVTSLWFHGNREAISLVAKQYLTKPLFHSYSYRFSFKSLRSMDIWVNRPYLSAGLVKFSFTKKIWELILYHFIGKKALLFAKDRRHLYLGSHIDPMYAVGLWTWRNFWQSQGAQNTQFFESIDRAIGEAINPRSSRTFAKKIQEGTDPVILPTGWEEHSVAVVFIGSLLFICNRGERGRLQTHDLTAYRIKNNAITKELVSQIIAYRSADFPMSVVSEFLFDTLPKALDARVDGFCELIHTAKCQPPDLCKPICTAANLRLAIYATLLSQESKEGGHWDLSTPLTTYKDYVFSARYSILHKYLQANK